MSELQAAESRNTSSAGSTPSARPALAVAVLVALVLLLAGGLYLILNLRSRVNSLEAALERQRSETTMLEDKLHMTNKSIEEGMQALGSKVSTNEEEIARRTAELKAQQEQAATKLSAAQRATSKQVAEVNSQVSGVKSELGGARSDIASTRTDLAATNAKLESAMGDLNVHSGLIAKNHDELEFLKHKGDRNYYEFTLRKKERKPISTVSLELRKTDPKKSRFTLNVYADDRTYEKKDRTLGEPLQFYTGREHQLYEVVVFDENKEAISGYLSTPK